eukprot:122954-Chlamydomonas_euryale.AAC.1
MVAHRRAVAGRGDGDRRTTPTNASGAWPPMRVACGNQCEWRVATNASGAWQPADGAAQRHPHAGGLGLHTRCRLVNHISAANS